MTDKDVVVRAEDVRKTYRIGTAEVHALRGVDLEIYAGEYLSIMGPSGSGKSTLFNMMGGLDTPSGGKVFIRKDNMKEPINMGTLDASQLAWLRCNMIGYIFQTYNILPVMTALQNVTLPMLFRGLATREANHRGAELLKKVGLGDRMNHRPGQLSGGQQQRVAIARAFANDPRIILADEPTSNLDIKTGSEIIQCLAQMKDEHGVTVISATHDHKMLMASDRVVWIRDGRIERIEKKENLDIREGQIGV